jgi:hypothetical protein
MTESEIINLINESYSILSKQKDLSPKNETVNKTLSSLVLNLIDKDNLPCAYCDRIMCNDKVAPCITPIRNCCQAAECEMEKYWSDYLSKKADLSFETLKEFWYFDQYYHIALKENRFIDELSIENPNFVFIGSGPLPMSGIILNKIKNFDITLVDIDSNAIAMSEKLCSKLSKNIAHICSDAVELDYKNYDLVFVASMVSNKPKLMKKLHEDKVKHIIIRDAKGFSKLFYEALEDEIFEYYRIKDTSPADGLTINTSYLLERI